MEGQVNIWRKAWRVARWFVLAFVLFYAFGLAMNAWHWWKTPAAVERIHARTVTMEMVMGENLPPEPLAKERDRTVAGVDLNANGVRDDVERAIHRNHADSAKIRAAQLQYARALQSQLTDVFSEGTLVAVIQEKGRATSCIRSTDKIDDSTLPDGPVYEWTREELDRSNELGQRHDAVVEPLILEVENLVLDTSEREFTYQQGYDYMTGYSGSEKANDCDIDLKLLPN